MEESKKDIIYIPVEDVIPNKEQPGLTYDEKDLQELANSILKYGALQPIVVKPVGEKFEISAGDRRFKAAKLAGLKKVPAVLLSAKDSGASEMSILENISKEYSSPIKEAKAYKGLIDKGFTQEDIATRLGMTQPDVASKIKLLSLPLEVQNALEYNQITEKHAKSLALLNNADLQNNLLKRIIADKMSIKQTEDEINVMVNKDAFHEEELPVDIVKFLSPQKNNDVSIDEEKHKAEVNKDSDVNVEILDFDVPDVVDIKDEDDETEEDNKTKSSIEYKEEPPLVNPFAKNEEVIEPVEEQPIIEQPKEIEEPKEIKEDSNEIKIEDTEMPSSPFSAASKALSETIIKQEEPQIPQKSIKEQLGEITYDIKPPTIEDLNTSEEYNKIEKINADPEEIEQEQEQLSVDAEFMNEYGEIDLPKVINKVRDFTNNLGTASEKIEVSEIDLTDKYQITIDIKKDI